MKYTKYVIVLFLLLISLCSCINDTNKSKKKITVNTESTKDKYAKFSFSKELHDFGNIVEGEILECVFYYENVGNANLIIKNIEASCGCTNVKWDKKPLKIGGKAKIIVSFDSNGRYGKQYKTISIFSNSLNNVKTLVLVAKVK